MQYTKKFEFDEKGEKLVGIQKECQYNHHQEPYQISRSGTIMKKTNNVTFLISDMIVALLDLQRS